MSRRINEYIQLTSGIRQPKSNSEVEISKTSASNWILVILEITPPQLSLIHEQYALIKFKPTINKYFNVVPRFNLQWGDLDLALNKIKEFLSLFKIDTYGYIRFEKFLKAFTIAKELKFDVENIDNKHYASLVFVYKKTLSEPIVYSSINKALKSLLISHGTLLECITNKYFYKDNIRLSFEPLSPEDFTDYTYKPSGDNQLRKTVIVFNDELEPVFEFNSAREMDRHFKVDGKIVRTAISKGAYQDYTIVSKPVSFRKEVFVFDSDTLKLITNLKSITAAMNYAKVNFYTMKNLLDTNLPHKSKIYSYNKTFKI